MVNFTLQLSAARSEEQATGMGRGNRFPIALSLSPRESHPQRLPIPDKVPG